MVDLGKLRIRKKAYDFEVRRRYQDVRSFKVKERPPIEVFKSQLKRMLSPPKPTAAEARKEEGAEKPQMTIGGFNVVVAASFIFIALIVLGLGILFLTSFSASGSSLPAQALDKPDIENTLLGSEFLTAGERGSDTHLAALQLDYETSNLDNYTIGITAYDQDIPSEIFILRSERFEASTYSDFLRTLRSDLGRRKMVLNEITVQELETVPDSAIVIVPSGVIPQELLGIGANLSLDSMADRGIILVYIGQSFRRMLNGSLVVDTPADTLKSVPIVFNEQAALSSTDGFNLFQPLYSASGKTGWITAEPAYGSVSIVRKGSGGIVFLPETLDGGWRNDYESAADDVARVIFETPWAKPVGEPKVYVLDESTGLSGRRYFFSNPFEGNASAFKVEFSGYSGASEFPVQETQFYSVGRQYLGDLYIEGGVRVVSTNLTDEAARLNARLREASPGQQNIFISVYDENGTEVKSFPQGNLDVQSEKAFDMPVYLPQAEYLVKVIDDTGRIYAQSYLKVVSIDIVYLRNAGNKDSVYVFEAQMDGEPVQLADTQVIVDGGSHGKYDFVGSSRFDVDVASYTGGSKLDYGDHTFDFTSGNLKQTVTVSLPRPYSIFTDPLFYGVIIFTVSIVGVGVLFAKQDVVFYFVDIPDFPPVTRTKIPLPSQTILSIFQKVNENYRWQTTPLTIGEIKNGFREIFHKGAPIYITDYNVEFLLSELERRGEVRGCLGYYGLSHWEDEAGRSMDYLSMMRRLRDICVNNAVPFTGTGESESADSEATVVGQQVFLHFFEPGGEPSELFKRMLATINSGLTFVLFKSEADRFAFMDLLSSPSAPVVIAKMEAEGGSLQFLTFDEFEATVKDLKGM